LPLLVPLKSKIPKVSCMLYLLIAMASSPPKVPLPPYLGESSKILNFKQLSDEFLKEV